MIRALATVATAGVLAAGASLPLVAPAAASPGFCANVAQAVTDEGRPRQVAHRFARIAWRESGCRPTAWVVDHDDLGGGVLGLNFRTAGLRRFWRQVCGVVEARQVLDLATNVRCALAAYDRLGWRPWS